MTLVALNRDSMNVPDAFETAFRNPADEYDRIPEAAVRRAARRLRDAFVELFAALWSVALALIAVSVHHRASERVAEENDRAAYGVERSALALGGLLHGRLGRRFLGADFLLMALGARKLGDPLCQIGLVVGWRDAGGGFSPGGMRKPRIRVVLSVGEQTDELLPERGRQIVWTVKRYLQIEEGLWRPAADPARTLFVKNALISFFSDPAVGAEQRQRQRPAA